MQKAIGQIGKINEIMEENNFMSLPGVSFVESEA